MSIKRYLANKDNTITSAFKINLSSRGTGANMGSSDILEMFGIFGQASSSSLEQSRILVQFPINKILTDRTAGRLPASGSINFKLKLFNAEHNQTVPENITCTVTPIVKPWSEGAGLDMESYLDEGPSNWTSASKGVAWTNQGGDFLSSSYISSAPIPLHFQQYLETGIENLDVDITGLVEEFLISEAGTAIPATGSITFNQDTPPSADDKFKIYGHNGDYRIFQFSNADATVGNTVLINLPSTTIDCVTALSNAVNTHLGSVIASTPTTASAGQATATLMVDTATFGTTALQLTNADGSTHTITAAALGGGTPSSATQLNTDLIGNANDGATQLKASLDAAALAGNINMTVSAITNNTGGNPRVITLRQTTAGNTGAKPLAGSMITENKVVINNTGSSAQGTLLFIEPEIKVALTQRASTFYGNTLISSSVASGIDVDNFSGGSGALNYGVIIKLADSLEDGSQSRSYYTKKFFARSSHHFLERPVIEAQWDSSIKDDRGTVIKASPLASEEDNLNSIYLYNRIRGTLKDIPHTGTDLVVQLVPNLGADPESVIRSDDTVDTYITASKKSTGIYEAQFAYSGSKTSLRDVWISYDSVSDTKLELFSGSSFAVSPISGVSYEEIPSYNTKIVNLKSAYSSEEQATFRVYTRNKNWKPNIYTVASSTAPVNTIRDAYYKIRRVADDMTVITYSTSSLQSYSSLSYDISGSYFDLDMSILEPNYLYEISFLYKNGTDYVEQKERFKFRVDP